MDKTRYKSTYDQYNGITTLTILDLQEADEGQYEIDFLPPANVVCEGYVFTRVCHSFCSQGGGVGIPACNGPTVYKQLH